MSYKSKVITPTYRSWSMMKSRCNNPKDTNYRTYGGRGIKVCEEWNLFANFIRDMGERPEGTTIDRIDVNKGYYKENCRWATPSEQQLNRRCSMSVVYKGEHIPLVLLCKRLGLRYRTIWARIDSGWTVERAIEEPIDKRRVSKKPKPKE
jgi:hypothetical protein